MKIFFLIHLLAFVSCNSNSDDVEPEMQINREVANFLNQMVDIMEENSINKNTIDWPDFRNQVLEKGFSAQNIAQTDDALRQALVLLGDNHSFIVKEDGSFISGSNIDCPLSSFDAVTTPANIGYVQVSSFSGTDAESTVAFAESVQDAIEAQDNEDITGWIVDLRNNTGGNMWPMLAGIGPILGEGIGGYFIGPNDTQTPWSFSYGAAIIGSNTLVQVTDNYILINPNPKVALLMNKAVTSSGEAIAISFVGRDNTMSFGTESCGLSTANSGFDLDAGYTLLLTIAYMADRNQNLFGVPITPDTPATEDTIIQDAIDYLNN